MHRLHKLLASAMVALVILISLTGAPAIAESCEQTDILPAINRQLSPQAAAVVAFSQLTHIKVLSAPLQSSGTIYIDQAQGIVWHTEQPLNSYLVISDDGVDPGTGLIESSRMMGLMLRQLITGDFTNLTRIFNLKGCVHEQTWQLQLHPINSLLADRVSELQFTGGQWIHHLILQQPDGNRLEVRFAEPQAVTSLPATITRRLATP